MADKNITSYQKAFYQVLDYIDTHLYENKDKYQVEIVEFPGSKVAVFEHRGNPDLIGNSVQKFIEWSKQNQIPFIPRVIYNLVYDDPAITEPEKYRFDICVAVNSDVK